MSSENRSLHRVELVLLCLFSFALPLVEAPKNIFLVLFFLVWFGRSLQMRNWGDLPRFWNAAFIGIFLAAVLSVSLSPYRHRWDEIRDIACYLLLGWTLARSALVRVQKLAIVSALILATLVGLAQGYWKLYRHTTDTLQLHSVGHVNHSALYGMGIAVLAIALAVGARSLMGSVQRRIAIVVAFVFLGVMVSFASRGALVAYLLTAGIYLAFCMRWGRIRFWPIVLAAVVILGGALYTDRAMFVKMSQNFQAGGYTTAGRVEAARSAIEYWRHHRLTGVGAANFNAVSPAMVRDWLTERGETFVERDYLFSTHAHNVFFNTLAERGVIGELALLAFMVAWLFELWRRRPRGADDDELWLCWGAGLSGFGLVFMGGLFNTTLHHEHGMLAMVCLALLLGVPWKRVK